MVFQNEAVFIRLAHTGEVKRRFKHTFDARLRCPRPTRPSTSYPCWSRRAYGRGVISQCQIIAVMREREAVAIDGVSMVVS